jgi:hypothetical protein
MILKGIDKMNEYLKCLNELKKFYGLAPCDLCYYDEFFYYSIEKRFGKELVEKCEKELNG